MMAQSNSATANFPGFPKDLVRFLADLSNNNDKNWFDAHRSDYERLFVEPARQFISALAAPLSAFDPPLNADPKTNRSLRRIHRDTRFSKDKRPFHDHLHVIFWLGARPNHGPGVHVVIGPDSFGFGAGQWGFEGETLNRYRQAVSQPQSAGELASAIAHGEKQAGTKLDPPALSRPPRGFDTPTEHADLLRHKCIVTRSDEPHPEWLFDHSIVEELLPRIEAMMPLIRWLSRHLG